MWRGHQNGEAIVDRTLLGAMVVFVKDVDSNVLFVCCGARKAGT